MLKSVAFADLITFARDSAACYFDSSGILQQAANDVARFDHDPVTGERRGLLIENTGTNSLRNNTMVGAVAGTPGTVPTNWILLLPSGITSQIVGVSASSGISYIEWRWSGTAAANGNILVLYEPSTQVVAAAGQTWTHSVYLRLAAGSLAGTGTFGSNQISVDECDASGNFLAGSSAIIAPTGAAIATQRTIHTRTLTNVATGRVRCYLNLGVGIGQAIDLNLRIGLPQLEQGAHASSPIKTSGTAVTRAADLASINTLSPWFNAVEGTIVAAWMDIGTANSDIVWIPTTRWPSARRPATRR